MKNFIKKIIDFLKSLFKKKYTKKEKAVINREYQKMINSVSSKKIYDPEKYNLTPKKYGEYLQLNGKQKWNKKK